MGHSQVIFASTLMIYNHLPVIVAPLAILNIICLTANSHNFTSRNLTPNIFKILIFFLNVSKH
jgi:hypothetical protein